MPRLLIVKTSSLGDVIHNLPVLADIRTHFPTMEIDWVVEESFAEIPRLHPAVSEVIPVAIRRWRHHLFSRATWQEITAFRHRLASRRYDVIVDAQGLLKSALVACCAKGPRHGQDRTSAREPLAAAFYRHTHAVPRGQHAVARNRQLTALALGYPPPTTPPDYGIRPPDVSASLALPERYVVGLHATSRASKLWPTENWVELGRQLAMLDLPLVLPWGNAAEQQRAQSIAAAVPTALVLPRLGLAALASILAGARAVAGVDTGLVHLAVALNTPTVALYTDTNPSLTGVYPADSRFAFNLGGVGHIPDVPSVLATIQSILNLEHSAS